MDVVSLALSKGYTNEKLNSLPSNAPTETISFDNGIYSVGNNVVNGQVNDIKIKGLTATNIISNGDFANGTTGWRNIDAVVDGIAEKTATAKFGAITKYYPMAQWPKYAGHKLYVAAKFKASSDNVALSCNDGVTTYANHSGSGNFERYSLIKMVSPDPINLTINVQDNNSSDWQKFYVDYIFAVDLTATFGAGNEPTIEQCDKIFPHYFDGTKSTVSAVRLKSVGKNLLSLKSKRILTNKYADVSISAPYYRDYDIIIGATRNGYINSTFVQIYEFTENRIDMMSTNPGFGIGIKFKANSGETYVKGNGIHGIGFFDKDGNCLTHSGTSIVTAPSGTAFGFAIITPVQVQVRTVFENFQVERGTIATPYEPYKESTVYINGAGELRSLPNGVKDEVNVSQGKRTQRVSNEYTINSDLIRGLYAQCYQEKATSVRLNLNIDNTVPSDTTTGNDNAYIVQKGIKFSSQDAWGETNIRWNKDFPQYYIGSMLTDGTMGLTVSLPHTMTGWEGEPTVQQIRDYFNANPATLNYQLATPIVTKLPAQPPLQVFPNGTVYVEPVGDPSESTLPTVELTVPIGASNKFGSASHDYEGAAADWVLNDSEQKCLILVATNSGGNANIILPKISGLVYLVDNKTDYNIVCKSVGDVAGTTILSGNSSLIYNI